MNNNTTSKQKEGRKIRRRKKRVEKRRRKKKRKKKKKKKKNSNMYHNKSTVNLNTLFFYIKFSDVKVGFVHTCILRADQIQVRLKHYRPDITTRRPSGSI